MPFNAGVQLSFELTKAFPIRSIAESAGSKLLKYARDLRMSGSDVVVEIDLAAVFGRGKIVQEIEQGFRKVVKVQDFTFLRHGCEISLDSGAGPTLLYGFQNSQHFSTIIQLSFLGWTHDRSSLATAIDQAMVKRFEMGVPGASASPGYEGILKSLAACSSQSSAFVWSDYIRSVDTKLQQSIPGYQYSQDYVKLSPAALTAAMDYLYVVQQLSESRKIMVSNAMGSITFIIWAHYILGLNVLINSEVSPTIAFGDKHNPHVQIIWSELNSHGPSLLPVAEYPGRRSQPSIQLLDEDMSVILDSAPEPERWTDIRVDSRYPLLGYGATYLHRLFNSDIMTNDLDPIYQESVKLIVALAIWVSRRVDRDINIPLSLADSAEVIKISSPRINVSVDIWRILASAKSLFPNVPGAADTSTIDEYVKQLSQGPLDEISLPNVCTTFLKRVPIKARIARPVSKYIYHLQCLASLVFVFSFVPEIQSCSAIPLREVIFSEIGFTSRFLKACKDPKERLCLKHDTIFCEITKYLSAQAVPEGVFLYSDFGWSVYFDTFGDRDPTHVKPELIHVRKGVPTNKRTTERKMLLRDGYQIPNPKSHPFEEESQPIKSREYVPRSSATASWTEFWSTGAEAFEHSMCYHVTPKKEWRENGRGPSQVFSYCRQMQTMLWETFTTATCDHSKTDSMRPIKLGMDAVAVLGWLEDQGKIQDTTERFIICLTKGEPRIRWLAAHSSIWLGRRCNALDWHEDPKVRVREVMLRTEDCCDSCALEQTAAVSGNHYWILIL